MDSKSALKNNLKDVLEEVTRYVATLDDSTFRQSPQGKWSIAQQLEHLCLSHAATALSLGMPANILQNLFPPLKRAGWNYDEVVWQYQLALSEGAKASLPYQPRLSLLPARMAIMIFWKTTGNALMAALDRKSDEELDACYIPHPLLGKITLRELLYFTEYHIRHHLKSIRAIGG